MSAIFSAPDVNPVQPIDPSEDARELRRRIAKRGGEQSTILTSPLAGNGAAAQRSQLDNVFAKQKLGGAR